MSGRGIRRLLRITAFIVLLLLVLLPAPRALALDARAGDQIVVRAGETIDDDLYVAAQSIVIDGTIRGDLIAAAQTITVNGTIEGGLTAAAQTVVVNGTVRDTTRVAAQAVLLDSRARAGRDLVALVYSLENRAGSAVGRDLVIAGYQALLAGNVVRNVKGWMQALELRGNVGGDVEVSVGTREDGTRATAASPPPAVSIPAVPPGLTVADSAHIGGRLVYTSSQQYPIGGEVSQGVTWNPRPVAEPTRRAEPTSMLVDQLRRLVILLIVGLLLVWLLPRSTRRLVETLEAQPLPSLGWGAIAWLVAGAVAVGIGVVTLFLTIGFGIATLVSLAAAVVALGLTSEAILTVGLGVFAAFVAQALAGYLGGHWLLRRVRPDLAAHRVWPLLIGVPIFVILTAIPILGGLIGLLAAVAVLGAVWIAIRDWRQAAPPAPRPAGGIAEAAAGT